MRSFVVIVLLSSAGMLSAPEKAAAQEQIAVAGPQGLGSTRLRERLTNVFRNDSRFEVLEYDDVRAARREAGSGPRALARHLEAWVVSGHTVRRNREFQTTLVIFDGEGTRRGRAAGNGLARGARRLASMNSSSFSRSGNFLISCI